jgi:branched-chain amino acid transport system substrate-binding protein
MAEYLFNKLVSRRPRIIRDVGSDYSEGLSEYFVKTFEGLGGTVAANEAFRGGDVDFRAQLTNMKNRGA